MPRTGQAAGIQARPSFGIARGSGGHSSGRSRAGNLERLFDFRRLNRKVYSSGYGMSGLSLGHLCFLEKVLRPGSGWPRSGYG